MINHCIRSIMNSSKYKSYKLRKMLYSEKDKEITAQLKKKIKWKTSE